MKRRRFTLILMLCAISFSFLLARSSRVSQVPYGNTYSCNLCHTAGGGTPRNSFGQAVETITGPALTDFWGPTLASADSDGDGFSNGVELQDSAGTWTSGSADPGSSGLVTHPGNASDYPTISLDAIRETDFILKNNYPNPFNPYTIIAYYLPVSGHITLDVYDLNGKKISTLVDGHQTIGNHTAAWTGVDDRGRGVESGIYLYKLSSGTRSEAGRMVLIK